MEVVSIFEMWIIERQIEIRPSQNKKFWVFAFSEFEAVLKSAKEALWKMRKST